MRSYKQDSELYKDSKYTSKIVQCSFCGKNITISGQRLVNYLNHKNIYCSHSCVMKYIHKVHDGVKYCKVCKQNTKHIIGIGCLTCYNKSESHKEHIVSTVKIRYSEEYTNVWQVPKVKDKIVKTSIQRYNMSNPGNNRNARVKAANTMRQKGHYSKDEDYFASVLDKLNIRYETQYSSELYPFACDFYLIDYDIYIELNIYWSHNDHFYDSSNSKDIEILEYWKSKVDNGHKQYKNAINVWTNKDLLKRDIAYKNNLNYVVLWSRKELESYINYMKELLNNSY